MENKIIELLLNYKLIEAKKESIGLTVKRNFMVFYSSRVNGFPYKKDAFFSLTLCRKTNSIKGFDFTNFSEKPQFETAENFIDYILNLIK